LRGELPQWNPKRKLQDEEKQDKLRSLIYRILSFEEEKRPSFEEVAEGVRLTNLMIRGFGLARCT